ncbi:hypothetical protein [Massilia violaceinigra]|nr:hypothetical protein [Massilia violaceinigra]
MSSYYQFLLTSCILVLLPIIPAVVIFKACPQPQNSAEGEGTLYGMRWKFGGAFAAYLVVALMVLSANKHWFQAREVEVWTVRGAVNAGNIDIKNVLAVRSLPQTLSVESDGSYEFKVIVQRSGDVLNFPKVLFELRSECRERRTVRLDGVNSAGTFDVLKSENKIDIKRNDADRSIEVSPIVLGRITDANCTSMKE